MMEPNNPFALTVSETARAQLARIREASQASWVRLFIQGGGCAGFSYAFTLDEDRAPEDLALDEDACRLLVDAQSAALLAGAHVDWVEDLQGSRFVITNPLASTTCGCGSSFQI